MISDKPRLAISFSGGRTSAYMSILVLAKFGESHDIRSTFVNTGCEDERTLEFVHDCDRHIFEGQLEWIEPVTNETGTGMTASPVTFESCSRNGEPYEASVAKYGVYGPTNPACNTRLKTAPLQWWRAHKGWAYGTYDTAIGIRSDEIDRISQFKKEKRLVYPLVQAGITKRDVLRYMSQFEWDLKIPGEHYGNCVWCWKKTLRKHLTLAKENPSVFEFPAMLEEKYGHMNPGNNPAQDRPRVFFRKNLSAREIVQMSETEYFKPWKDKSDSPSLFDDEFDADLDVGGGCGDSCEVGADE
jgi:hypothetical protein